MLYGQGGSRLEAVDLRQVLERMALMPAEQPEASPQQVVVMEEIEEEPGKLVPLANPQEGEAGEAVPSVGEVV